MSHLVANCKTNSCLATHFKVNSHLTNKKWHQFPSSYLISFTSSYLVANSKVSSCLTMNKKTYSHMVNYLKVNSCLTNKPTNQFASGNSIFFHQLSFDNLSFKSSSRLTIHLQSLISTGISINQKRVLIGIIFKTRCSSLTHNPTKSSH